jgi:protein TonB
MSTWGDLLAEDAGTRARRATLAAAALSIALHLAVILPFVELPMPASDSNDQGISVTVEFDSSPHGTPSPKPTQAVLLPEPTPPDPPSTQDFRPTLEETLAPVDAPPAVDGREFAELKPVPPNVPTGHTEPKPPIKAQPKPQPPAITRALREDTHEGAPGTSAHPASISPGQGAAQRQAEQDYFRQIVQKISRYRFASREQNTSPQGLVVTRLTLARDGQVLDVSLLKSSGSPSLDGAVVQTIRQASPFPPLPADLGGEQSFIVPVNYTRDQ